MSEAWEKYNREESLKKQKLNSKHESDKWILTRAGIGENNKQDRL